MTLSPSRPWWRRLWQQVVPEMPDFHGMLEAQAENLCITMNVLSEYLYSGEGEDADKVNELVEQGHALRDTTLQQLYSSFITPIDREDIYTLAMAIDHILDYIKNTMREVELLQIEASECMQSMAAELGKGADSLALGLAKLRAGEAEEVAESVKTRESERRVEDLYREVLELMFQGEEYRQLVEGKEPPDVRACLDYVVTRIKRREVYRHLSNAADRLAHAGEALRDISVKYDAGSGK